MTNRERFLIILIVSALSPPISGCNGAKSSANVEAVTAIPAVLTVKAESPVRTEWTVKVPISGNFRSQSMVEVKSEVGGRLVALYFKEGDLVHKGQLIAEIDPANYRLAYEQASAVVKVSEAALARIQVMADHARREKERADNLVRNGGITEKDQLAATTGIKDAETQVLLAEAQINQARATAAIAEKALKDCRILATADGHVQKKSFDQGSLLAMGAPLYTLVDNTRLELDCLLPSYRLSEIHSGQRAGFTTPTWGERTFEGTVVSINPMVETDNRAVKVTLHIANPGGDLLSGMYARGDIEVRRQKGALVIPRPALVTEREESSSGSVFLIRDGKAVRRQVQVGGIQKDRVWISGGLEDGDRVITEIGPAIKDGVPVQIAGSGGSQGE